VHLMMIVMELGMGSKEKLVDDSLASMLCFTNLRQTVQVLIQREHTDTHTHAHTRTHGHNNTIFLSLEA
jgi:hypothetical protein